MFCVKCVSVLVSLAWWQKGEKQIRKENTSKSERFFFLKKRKKKRKNEGKRGKSKKKKKHRHRDRHRQTEII